MSANVKCKQKGCFYCPSAANDTYSQALSTNGSKRYILPGIVNQWQQTVHTCQHCQPMAANGTYSPALSTNGSKRYILASIINQWQQTVHTLRHCNQFIKYEPFNSETSSTNRWKTLTVESKLIDLHTAIPGLQYSLIWRSKAFIYCRLNYIQSKQKKHNKLNSIASTHV